MSRPVTVFISYSVDSAEHSQRVLSLANRFREDGVDATIDQYEEAPPEGWPRWMDRQIRESDFVLIVCTQRYNDKVQGDEEPGKGLGVRWESTIVLQHIYDAGTLNYRFIPVLLSSADKAHIPTLLRATTYYDVSSDEGYLKLYRRLTQQPAITKAPLGTVRQLPPTPPSVSPTTAATAEAPGASGDKRQAPAGGDGEIELPVLRNLLMAVLITDSDLEAFCLDYYPEIYRRFSSGMDRVQKVNLLLSPIRAGITKAARLDLSKEMLRHLEETNPRSFLKHKGLLGLA